MYIERNKCRNRGQSRDGDKKMTESQRIRTKTNEKNIQTLTGKRQLGKYLTT